MLVAYFSSRLCDVIAVTPQLSRTVPKNSDILPAGAPKKRCLSRKGSMAISLARKPKQRDLY
jgi:hypothetical protein